MVAMESNGIKADVRDWFSGSLDERRYILINQSPTLEHDIATEMAELVDQATATDHGGIIDLDFTGELTSIGHNDSVAKAAIVSNVIVSHNQAILTDHGFALRGSAAVDGDTLAESSTITDISVSFLTLELKILRDGSDHSAGEDGDTIPDTRAGEDGDISIDDAIIADFDILIYGREITYPDIIADLGIWANFIKIAHSIKQLLRRLELFIFDDLSHELSLAYHLFAYESITFDHGATATDLSHKRDIEEESITGDHLLAELDIIYLKEISGITFGLIEEVEHEHTGGLRHCLDLENAGHDRFLGEVTLEEGFIGGDILDSHCMLLVDLDHLIDEQEGIAVRELTADFDIIDQRLEVRVINGSLDLGMLHLMAHLASELIVDSMSGAYSHDAALDGTADQGEVADDINDLMASRLIVPDQGLGVDITEFVDVHVRHLHNIADMIDAILRDLLIINNDSIVEVTTLDKVGFDELLDLAYENESSGGSHLGFELGEIVEHSELIGEDGGIILNHTLDAEPIVGINGKSRTGLLISELLFLLNNIIILVSLLLDDADLLDEFDITDGAAVEDREFGAIDVDDTVVDAGGI